MNGHSLTSSDYQDLMKRNWRRSGIYCYKPINTHSCCPNFPIICLADKFILTKSKRKLIQNLNNYMLNGDIRDTRCKINYIPATIIPSDQSSQSKKIANLLAKFEVLRQSSKSRDRRFVSSCQRLVEKLNLTLEQAVKQVIERNRSRHNAKHIKFASTIEDYLYPKKSLNPKSAAQQPSHRFELRFQHVQSKACQMLRAEQVELMQKYQLAIHNDDTSRWDEENFCDFLVDSPLGIEDMPGYNFTGGDTIADSDDTYAWPTTTANHESDYLLFEPPALPTRYGTYHCSYMLDGKLIALAVLDMLPKCLTSVYFLYDTSLKDLNLGIYSALIEIAMTRAISKRQLDTTPSQLTYHLGFYVHECKKMLYKSRFRPSYLMCSETNQYVETEACFEKLIGTKYARFSDSGLTEDEELATQIDITSSRLFDIPVYLDAMGGSLEPSLANLTNLLDYFRWIRANTILVQPQSEILVRKLARRYIGKVGYHLSRRLRLQLNCIHRAITKSPVRAHCEKDLTQT